MLPKSVQTMLKLDSSWREWHSGAVVAALYRQLRSQRLRTLLAQEMISASFDLANAASIRRFKRIRRVRRVEHSRWRIGDLDYFYYPVVNDHLLFHWSDHKRKNRECFLIVPPDVEWLFRSALQKLIGVRTPYVHCLGSFIHWRTSFASIDLSLNRNETTLWLLGRFNRRVRHLKSIRSLTIDLAGTEEHVPLSSPSNPATPRPS
jgi:hypothetical protein